MDEKTIDISICSNEELMNYLTHDGKVLLDIDRLNKAASVGRITHIQFPDGTKMVYEAETGEWHL